MIVQGNNFADEIVFKHRMHNRDNYTYPLHVHQFVELIFVLEGELPIAVNGKSEVIRSGECALIMPFSPHKFKARSHVKMGMYTFSPAFISDFFSSHSGYQGSAVRFVPCDASRKVYEDRIMNADDLSFYSIKSFLYLILNDYLSQVKLVPQISNDNVASKVGTYVNEHFDEQINLKTVADALGYSSNYLSHCIKKTFDMNFCTFVASLRIDKARRLLAETDKSSLEISFLCGFGSERTFHRKFKEITGRAPLEYRAKFACSIIDPGTVIFPL